MLWKALYILIPKNKMPKILKLEISISFSFLFRKIYLLNNFIKMKDKNDNIAQPRFKRKEKKGNVKPPEISFKDLRC